MEKSRRFSRLDSLRAAIAILLAAIIIPGCAQTAAEPATIKIGLLPIAESLPFYVAESEGYFREANLKVELVPFASAVERDAALQTGQIDAELNDPISALLLDKEKDDVRIVKVTYKATPQRAMVFLLAGPKSAVKAPADLKAAEIAISKNSIIEYVTDRLVANQGLTPDQVKKTEISKIPVRLEMLMTGNVAVAGLPDPFAFLAEKQGAKVVLHDGDSGIGQSVLTVRKEVLTSRGSAIKRLLEAHARAVETVNASPEKYRPLLVEKAKVPAPIADSFPVPKFPAPAVPSKAEIEDAVNWMQARGLLARSISYEQIVDASFIKK